MRWLFSFWKIILAQRVRVVNPLWSAYSLLVDSSCKNEIAPERTTKTQRQHNSNWTADWAFNIPNSKRLSKKLSYESEYYRVNHSASNRKRWRNRGLTRGLCLCYYRISVWATHIMISSGEVSVKDLKWFFGDYASSSPIESLSSKGGKRFLPLNRS